MLRALVAHIVLFEDQVPIKRVIAFPNRTSNALPILLVVLNGLAIPAHSRVCINNHIDGGLSTGAVVPQ